MKIMTANALMLSRCFFHLCLFEITSKKDHADITIYNTIKFTIVNKTKQNCDI